MVEMMGFPRRFAALNPSFASSVGRNPKNVPLARFLNGRLRFCAGGARSGA